MTNSPPDIVIASHNEGKIKELSSFFEGLYLSRATQFCTSIKEDAVTFVENAIIKARFVAQKSGYPTIGDDSGLLVHALNDEPGVRSARYAGEPANMSANLKKLTHRIKDLKDRSASFVCVLAAVLEPNDPCPIICQGILYGSVTDQFKGSAGFGYDPAFIPKGRNQTVSELGDSFKSHYSHRSIAVRKLLQKFQTEPRWARVIQKMNNKHQKIS